MEYAFQHYGIMLEAEARKFHADIWSQIQTAEKIRDDTALAECERDLRCLCQNYFALMQQWRHDEEERFEEKIPCAGSQNNMREALAALPLLEKQFFRYCLCYLELNRALIQSRSRISHLARDYNIDDTKILLQVNSGTGVLLNRAHREKKILQEKRLRLERVKSLLQQKIDPLMEDLQTHLPSFFGAKEGDHQLTLLKGLLRQEYFDRAHALVRIWPESALKTTALNLVSITRSNVTELKAKDALMLHSKELALIGSILDGEEAQATQFLAKYNIPYMVFQYRNLLHLGYIVGKIGSLEGLIVHHAKLVSLAARPLHDDVQAQRQEQAVLVPTRALLQNKFHTLGPIFDKMETTLQILDTLFTKTRDYGET